MIKIILICFLPILSFSVKAQRSAPSHVDLNASYCAAYLKESINTMSSIISDTSLNDDLKNSLKNDLFKFEINLKRIQNYLLPRTRLLEVDGLISAYNQHAMDVRNYNLCVAKCPVNLDKISCFRSCSEVVGFSTKSNQCNNLSWMPY